MEISSKNEERVIDLLKGKITGSLRVLRGSDDPELERYLQYMSARGSTDMDESGSICIKLASDAPYCVLLEECGHAIQYERDGHAQLSVDDTERLEREADVAKCLLDKPWRLNAADLGHYKAIVTRFETT